MRSFVEVVVNSEIQRSCGVIVCYKLLFECL